MYNIEHFEKEIPTCEYVDNYVEISEFLEYCKECRNYKKVWSCPEFDFDVMSYWNGYSTLRVVAKKINFEEGTTPEEGMEIMKEVKDNLSDELWELEEKYPGSISLSGGSCYLCGEGNCSRPEGKPCRYPEKMRYSIEALGGNVGLTVRKLMGIQLEWIEEGKLPSYFVLIGGLLMK